MPRNSVQSTNFPSFSPSKTAKTLKVESLLNECEQQSSSLWDGILAQANDKVSVAPSIFVDVTPWVILSCSVLVLLKESSSNRGGGGAHAPAPAVSCSSAPDLNDDWERLTGDRTGYLQRCGMHTIVSAARHSTKFIAVHKDDVNADEYDRSILQV